MVYNGAEPIRSETMGRFRDTYAAYGLRPSAVWSAYGMAETTLLISTGAGETGPPGFPADRAALEGRSRWIEAAPGAEVRPVKEAYWRVPAAAGVESDIVDFAKWMQAMMGKRPDVLPGEVLALAHRPRVGTGRLYGGALRQANSDAAYGLGWRSFTYGGHRLEGQGDR